MKHLIATWVGTNPGGGVSIQNFKQIKQYIREFPDGRSELIVEDEPIGITVRPRQSSMSRTAKPFVLDNQDYWLNKGEFVVQDIEENRDELKALVKAGLVRMNDWGLNGEFLGKKMPTRQTKRVVKKEQTVTDITGENTEAAKKVTKEEVLEKIKKE